MSRRGCCKRGDVEEVAVFRLKFISSRGAQSLDGHLHMEDNHEIIWLELLLVGGAYLHFLFIALSFSVNYRASICHLQP